MKRVVNTLSVLGPVCLIVLLLFTEELRALSDVLCWTIVGIMAIGVAVANNANRPEKR